MMVTTPSAAIFKYPFNSDHSVDAAKAAVDFEAKEDIQAKLIINPPPAIAEVFKKDRLLNEDFESVIGLFG